MMTRIRLKWIFNIEQDIEYFPVVDGVVDVFILLRGRQPSVAGPLENDRVGVLQMGSPGHSDTLNTRLQLNFRWKRRQKKRCVQQRQITSGSYGKPESPNGLSHTVGNCQCVILS